MEEGQEGSTQTPAEKQSKENNLAQAWTGEVVVLKDGSAVKALTVHDLEKINDLAELTETVEKLQAMIKNVDHSRPNASEGLERLGLALQTVKIKIELQERRYRGGGGGIFNKQEQQILRRVD